MYKIVLIFFAITLICVSGSVCQSIEGYDNNDFDPLNQWSLQEKEHFKKALSFQEIPNYNRDSANFYYEKTILLLENKKRKEPYLFAQVYRNWSDYNIRHFSFSILDSLAKTGWKYVEKLPNDSDNQVFLYSYLVNWSKIKLESGDFDTAILLFTKALSKVENVEDEELSANISMNKGWFYRRHNLTSENNLSLKNLHQGLSYYVNQDIKKHHLELFNIYKGLVGAYVQTSPDSTLYYLEKTASVIKFSKNPLASAWYHSCYGRELITEPANAKEKLSEKQIEKGETNILEALKILETYQVRNTTVEPFCYGLLGDIYLQRAQSELALSYYKKSVKGYIDANYRFSAGAMLQFISDTYLQQGNLDSALFYFKEFHKESVKFEQEKNQRSLRESELQIDVLKRDKELRLKEDQAFLYAIALGVIGAILGFLYFFYKKRQVRNRELQRLNNELESKNKQNELLLKEIHHRVKNNLEMVKSLISLQSAHIEDSETRDAMLASQNRVQSMGIIHQKLYQGDNLGSIEMKDYFVNLSEGILDSFKAEDKIQIECVMDDLELDIDTAVPLGLIVNELLTNAIKYAFPDSKEGIVRVSLKKEQGTLVLDVADNGVGKGLNIEPQGTGFGTQLVHLLTTQLNGKMQEDAKNGTHLSFTFKLDTAS
ncbi:MAG: two-component sensor histidine kinase [Roseivirga sp.]|jgi:two-component sensor histidine kinase